jgi:hypothetical protein
MPSQIGQYTIVAAADFCGNFDVKLPKSILTATFVLKVCHGSPMGDIWIPVELVGEIVNLVNVGIVGRYV